MLLCCWWWICTDLISIAHVTYVFCLYLRFIFVTFNCLLLLCWNVSTRFLVSCANVNCTLLPTVLPQCLSFCCSHTLLITTFYLFYCSYLQISSSSSFSSRCSLSSSTAQQQFSIKCYHNCPRSFTFILKLFWQKATRQIKSRNTNPTQPRCLPRLGFFRGTWEFLHPVYMCFVDS